jgi:cyclopropane-fatty-acyl-phospholipid synthase
VADNKQSEDEMTVTTSSDRTDAQRLAARTPAAFRAAVAILRRNWAIGTLIFHLPSGEEVRFDGSEPGPNGVILVKDFNFMRRVLAAGDIGFGESFMAGEWDTPDVATLLHVLCLNLDNIQKLIAGHPVVRAFNGLKHALRRNSRAGSRRNIEAHYDLGNAFYERWLDPSMTYSSALFGASGQSLEEAQRNKYASLAEALDLKPGCTVLEIGCGWGGFAEYAAREHGAHVTGITLSHEQHAFARERLRKAGLADRTDIRLIDYRDVQGQFDRIASIEMFEAVGEEYWPTFFGKVRDRLKSGGRAGLQVITIADGLFDHYRSHADFIQKHVFPGGMLPSETRLREEAAKVGLAWDAVVRFGGHYADTLGHWAGRFRHAWEDVRRLGFDERFRRLWLFYLGYCEAGFRTGRLDVMQFTAAKT